MRGAVVSCAVVASACGRIGFDPAQDAPLPPYSVEVAAAASELRGVAQMPDGRIVVVGQITSAGTVGGQPVGFVGGTDVLVAVVNADGTVAWARAFGSAANDDAWDVAAGADGTIFVTGDIAGPVDFGTGMLMPTGYNPFVAAFDRDGTARWAIRFGGDIGTGVEESAFRIAATGDGDVLVVGRVEGPVDFGDGAITTQQAQISDGFVARYRGADGQLRWKRRLVSQTASFVFGVAEDGAGNVYVTGMYNGTADLGGGVIAGTGTDDAFVASYDANDTYRWASTFGGPGATWGLDVVVIDPLVAVVGDYDQTISIAVPPSSGLTDSFIATYSTDGTPGWVRGFGGPGCDLLYRARNSAGELAVSGGYSGTIDLGDGPRTAIAATDTLIATFTPAGSVSWSASSDEGPNEDLIAGIAGTRATGFYLAGVLGVDLGPACRTYPVGGTGFVRRLAAQ